MSISMKEYIDEAEAALLHTYNRYQVVLDRGDGVWLYDMEGKRYLDFVSGIAVFALGYNNREYNDALKAQIDKIIHTSNYYYNVPAIEAAKKLKQASGMDRVFFTNSGTEAIEGALKIARRYAYDKKQGAYEIIAMEHSFHGRSTGALAVTGNDHYREPFNPLLPGVKFAKFNDLDSVKALVNDKTCAIIMETVQGEGGIYPADPEFIAGVRKLCDEHDLIMILDEIQCGMARSGSMFAWQHYGVKPDVMTVAKALGNGFPVGAFLACGKASTAMVPGDHGTTYGGNPFAGAAANAVLDIFEKEDILGKVNEIAPYLEETLDRITAKYDCVKEHRGMGLIRGLEFHCPAGPVIRDALLNQKLVLIGAGANIIRFVPPLVISRADVDEMAVRLEAAIEAAAQ